MIRRFFGSTAGQEETGGGELVSSIYIEAEDADFIGSSWVIFVHPDAIGTTLQANAPSAPPTDPDTSITTECLLTYNLPDLESGDYVAWLRVRAENTGQDSIFHRMNALDWQHRPTMFPISTTLEWSALIGDDNNIRVYSLSEGVNVFELHLRENFQIIDRIYITKNGDTPT